MFRSFVRTTLGPFAYDKMVQENRQRLDRVIHKHAECLWLLMSAATAQFFLAIRMRIEEPAFIALLIGSGILSAMLFVSWFVMSVRGMSKRQRAAGADDLVTIHLFDAFTMSLSMFLLLMLMCIFHAFLPEAHEAVVLNQQKLHIGIQVVMCLGESMWIAVIARDILIAAMAYDAADYVQEKDEDPA